MRHTWILSTVLLFGLSLPPAWAFEWYQQAADIDGEAWGDRSGWSVSLSADGRRVAIGAYLNDDNGPESGHVRVYEDAAGTWAQVGSDIDGEAEDDESGWSVSLSAEGSRVAIGAPKNDGNGPRSGHVRVYEDVAGTWMQVGSDIDGEVVVDGSGWSVSLSPDGSRVAIGAWSNNGNGGDSGHVRVYEDVAGSWMQVGDDIDGEFINDWSGYSVSLSLDGSRVAIGANRNDGNGPDSGHVRVYEDVAGTWVQVGSDIDGEAEGDHSGRSVSLSADGSRVAIGAYRNGDNGTNSGHVRVYEDAAGSWIQVGSDIDGEAADDGSGRSVSLSADGSRVAIGAAGYDGSSLAAGYVRVYEDAAGTWVQLGSDIDGEAEGDRSGWSVSLSTDGSRVAIGAFSNNENGTDAGHVRVYRGPELLFADGFETGDTSQWDTTVP